MCHLTASLLPHPPLRSSSARALSHSPNCHSVCSYIAAAGPPKPKLLSEANPAFGKMLSGIRSGEITAENAEELAQKALAGHGTSESKSADATKEPESLPVAPPSSAVAPRPAIEVEMSPVPFRRPSGVAGVSSASAHVPPAVAVAPPPVVTVDPLEARLKYRFARGGGTTPGQADREFMESLTAWMAQADKRYEEHAAKMADNSQTLAKLTAALSTVTVRLRK